MDALDQLWSCIRLRLVVRFRLRFRLGFRLRLNIGSGLGSSVWPPLGLAIGRIFRTSVSAFCNPELLFHCRRSMFVKLVGSPAICEVKLATPWPGSPLPRLGASALASFLGSADLAPGLSASASPQAPAEPFLPPSADLLWLLS